MALVGEVIMWAGALDKVPPNFLYCNGTQVLQSNYQALFNLIGNTFGADAAPGNFYLPDLRGRFIRGVDDGAGRDPDVGMRTDMQNASVLYQGVGSVQGHAFHAHAHQLTGLLGNGGDVQIGTGSTVATVATTVAGGNETRPINAGLYFIICFKADGDSAAH